MVAEGRACPAESALVGCAAAFALSACFGGALRGWAFLRAAWRFCFCARLRSFVTCPQRTTEKHEESEHEHH